MSAGLFGPEVSVALTINGFSQQALRDLIDDKRLTNVVFPAGLGDAISMRQILTIDAPSGHQWRRELFEAALEECILRSATDSVPSLGVIAAALAPNIP
jgi:hypothetical protein